MSSKKEEERHEKIIRGLMKLPPNRRCINCSSLGPQYVCTNFWTFVCITCSGIHREFTHRVKSVSMAKFTTQEVEALQKGGNQRAREQFLKDWDTQRMRLPNNSNPDKIREFIKSVYMDNKYAGSISSDKPPSDTQSLKGEDHKRASSYHSFSHSPPYDHQYEERRYGRQAGMLTRKPGSDRGHYEGKMSNFLYSPGRHGEQIYEDGFANEGSGFRTSDYSVSSDPLRFGSQLPNFNDPRCISPPSQMGDNLVEDAQLQILGTSSEPVVKEDINRISRAHRSGSSGSFGSFDSNSLSIKSANSGSLIDSVLEPAHVSGIRQADASTFPTLVQTSSSANTKNIDLFNQEVVQPQNTFLAPSMDLFAEFNQLPSPLTSNGQKSSDIRLSDTVGWATFDLPHHGEPPLKESQVLPSIVPTGEKDAPKGNIDLFSTTHNSSDWFSVQNLASQGHSSLVADQRSMDLSEVKDYANSSNLQLWNTFPDSAGNILQILSGLPHQHSKSQDMLLQRPPMPVDLFVGFKASKVTFNDRFPNPVIDAKACAIPTLTSKTSSSFPPSTIPQMGLTTQDWKASNPFDLPYDLQPEANNVFMDMSLLQDVLPELQLPATYPGGLPDPWFPTDSFSSFIPPAPQGGFAHIGGQVPSAQLQNIPAQGPVASIGGNPFA